MRQFFKFTLASMLGFILANIVLCIISIFLFFIVIGGIASMAKDFGGAEKVKVEPNSVLSLKLNYEIPERTNDNPFDNISFPNFEIKHYLGLNDIIASIKHAKTDDKIKGILLDVDILPNGFATLEEIRKALIDFKTSGKFVYTYSNILIERSYYLASVSDSIFIQPEGMMGFSGLNSEHIFFKGMFDKLDIEPIIIKVGKYKSAGEMFSNKKMSDPNRLQLEETIGSIYNYFLQKVGESRNIPADSLFNIANEGKVRNPKDALKYRLVDRLEYKDQLLSGIKSRLGVSGDDKINFMDVGQYRHSFKKSSEGKEGKIALIYAVGPIGMSKGNEENIGAERLSNAIRKAREDDDIKAIVMRVNSPGGSALASDVIWREVALAKKAKPFVISMGGVAASGGYYISCAADSIVAEPNTITGSIGVIGVLLYWQKFWNDKIGVTFDRVKTGKYADLGNPNRPMTEEEHQIIQKFVNDTYQDFITRVGKGRNMPVNMVDSLGGGRIYSGEEALKNGLIDKLGGIDDAIAIAARMAKIKNYKIIGLPEMESPFEKIMKGLSFAQMKEHWVKEELGDQYKIYKKIEEMKKMNGIYTIMPYDLDIK